MASAGNEQSAFGLFLILILLVIATMNGGKGGFF